MSGNIFKSIVFTLTFCLAVFSLVTILWSTNFGFDIDDEGCLLLLAKFPLESNYFIFKIQNATSLLLNFIPINIISYRIACVFFLSIGWLIFSIGSWLFLSKYFHDLVSSTLKWTYFSLLFTSVLLLFVFNYRTLSYNSFNSVLVLLIVGVLFFHLHFLNNSKVLSTLSILFVGFLFPFHFFVKFISCFSLIVAIVVILICFYWGNIKLLVWYMSSLIVGVVISILFILFILKDSHSFFEPYLNLFLSILGNSEYKGTHGSSFILQRYLNDIFILLVKSVNTGVVFLVFLNYFLVNLYKQGRTKAWTLYVPVLLFALIIYSFGLYKVSGELTYIYNSSKFYIFINLFLMSTIVPFVSIRQTKYLLGKAHLILIFLFLLILPFIAAAGTSVSLIMHTLLNLTGWISVAFFFIIYLSKKISKLYALVMYLCLVIVVFFHFIDGIIFSPHRLNAPLFKHEYIVKNMPILKGIKFDKETKLFFDEIKNVFETKTNFKSGDYIIGLYGLGGVVYALDAVSPGNNLFLNGYPSDVDMNCKALMSRKGKVSGAFLILDQEISEETIMCLNQVGVDYPKGYSLISKLYNPYHIGNPDRTDSIEIWSPLFRMK